MDGWRRFENNGWRGCRTADFVPPADFDVWLAELLHTARLRYPSRVIAPCTLDNGVRTFVKVLYGLGDNIHAWKNALKWRFRTSRAMHVAAVSADMAAAGVRCAEVLLAARRRTCGPWGWPTDLIVTREAPGAHLRRLLDSNAQDAERRALFLRGAARAVAQLHAAGFVHGDCQPGNVFLDENAAVCSFIDNDRTAHSCRFIRRRQEMRNVVQMGFGLLYSRRVTPAEWECFLAEYAEARPCDLSALRICASRLLARRLQRG